MKNILLILLVGFSISSFAQLPTTGDKKNIEILDTLSFESNEFGITSELTYRRMEYIRLNPKNARIKTKVGWYMSKAGAINTASDVNQQIDSRITTYDWTLDDIFSFDSLALDSAIDTVMIKFATNPFYKKYGSTNYDYDLYSFTVLDSIYLIDRYIDSAYVVLKSIEFFNNDYMKGIFKIYVSKEAYLDGKKSIGKPMFWNRDYTLVEFKPSIFDWMFEYRKVLKNTIGFPTTNLGYIIESW